MAMKLTFARPVGQSSRPSRRQRTRPWRASGRHRTMEYSVFGSPPRTAMFTWRLPFCRWFEVTQPASKPTMSRSPPQSGVLSGPQS